MADTEGSAAGGGGSVLGSKRINGTRALIAAWPLTPVVGGILAFTGGSISPLLLSLIPFAGIGYLAWPRLRMQMQWQRPTLQLPAEQFRLGETVDFVYQRESRRIMDVSRGSLYLELTCTEVFLPSGEDEDGNPLQNAIEVVVRETTQHSLESTPKGLRARGSFVVPATAGCPTLKYSHHRVSWNLTSRLEGPKMPNGSESFEVEVVAELAPGLAIQDTVNS